MHADFSLIIRLLTGRKWKVGAWLQHTVYKCCSRQRSGGPGGFASSMQLVSPEQNGDFRLFRKA